MSPKQPYTYNIHTLDKKHNNTGCNKRQCLINKQKNIIIKPWVGGGPVLVTEFGGMAYFVLMCYGHSISSPSLN